MSRMNTGGPGARLIDGRFELLEPLGGGGMGLVWRARDNALDREVALKEVRPPDHAVSAADPAGARQMRERVLREARALARLQHPNVVIIHHIVDAPEHPYPWLVMELVGGGSLADRLERGPLAVPEAARIGRGVLGALRAAHAAGVQHRDVKPGNVLLRTDGTPVLTDFGIAAIHDATTALTATGALIGSPEYIAPERIRGHEGNPSSDLWSLGMMLYVAVEGHHPLRRSSTLATLAAVLDEPLPQPTRSGRLGPLLAALLAKDPAARPDAAQLDRLLAEVADPVDAGPSDRPTRALNGPSAGAFAGSPAGTGPEGWAPAFTDTPPAGGHPTGTPHPGTPNPVAHPTGTPNPVGHASATPYPGIAPTGAPAHPAPSYPVGHPAFLQGQQPGGHPYAGATGPAGWGQQGTRPSHPAQPARGRRTPVVVLSAIVVALAGALTWNLLPDGAHANGSTADGGTPTSRTPTSHAPALTGGDATPAGVDTPAPATVDDLLTPAGVRATVKAMSPYIAGNKIEELVVYPTYASAEAPTASNPKLYDEIDYRDGTATHEPGGTVIGDEKPVDLRVFDWDVLPGLLAKAQKTLNVPHPTSRYIIIGPDLFDGTPTIRVYLSDAYGSGYLSADAKGKVRQTYPRGS